MRFQVTTRTCPLGGQPSAEAWTLEDRDARAVAEVWPGGGFNCFGWSVGGQPRADVLFTPADFATQFLPTRGGIPVLFPFPNRIRDGRFNWAGQTYQLPINDGAKKNAIHGFACRRAWRVVGHGADDRGAWVTGEFASEQDADDVRSLWPADYRLRLTYRLHDTTLRLEAEVSNPSAQPLPFGLGFHPYFRAPLVPGAGPADDCRVSAPVGAVWELSESLPTGKRLPPDAAHDLKGDRRLGELNLDDLYTDLAPVAAADRLLWRGSVADAGGKQVLSVNTDAAFRELVAFTPPHRQAVCLEPYTCPTDAINLQQRGLDAGLRVLAPGESWTGVVELRLAHG
jgi:aldose 1-epimerase